MRDREEKESALSIRLLSSLRPSDSSLEKGMNLNCVAFVLLKLGVGSSLALMLENVPRKNQEERRKAFFSIKTR